MFNLIFQQLLWNYLLENLRIFFNSVLRIRDILVRIQRRIRILGSVPLINGSGCGSGRPKIIPSGTLVHLHHTSKIKTHKKEARKQMKSRFFLLFLLDDGSIRICIVLVTTDSDADPRGPPPKKKHTDPTDQDADPQPCFSYIEINNFPYLFYITFSAYPLLATSEVLRMIEPPRMVRGAELGAGQTVGQLPANST